MVVTCVETVEICRMVKLPLSPTYNVEPEPEIVEGELKRAAAPAPSLSPGVRSRPAKVVSCPAGRAIFRMMWRLLSAIQRFAPSPHTPTPESGAVTTLPRLATVVTAPVAIVILRIVRGDVATESAMYSDVPSPQIPVGPTKRAVAPVPSTFAGGEPARPAIVVTVPVVRLSRRTLRFVGSVM